MRLASVGAGRAGTSFSSARARCGHRVELVHHDELERIGSVDLVLLAVPDDTIATIAAALPVESTRVVAHVAGSRSLAVLAPHPRVASIHPLITMPSDDVGAQRLVGATFAVAGDPLVRELVTSLRGRALNLRDEQRTAYHATATVAANHLVALLAHVERLAEHAGLSLEDFLPLSRMALEDVAERGVERALTGPASRGDLVTIDAHLSAIPASERATYVALAQVAFDVAERRSRSLA